MMKLIGIFTFILLMIFKQSKEEIIELDKIKLKNDSFEVRLISMGKKNYLQIIKFVNFDDFKMIKFWNFNISNYNYYTNYLDFGFLANRKIILDLRINRDHFEYFHMRKIRLDFYFISAFAIDSFSFNFNKNEKSLIWIYFYTTNFFLFKNNKLLDEANCKYDEFVNVSYFEHVNELHFKYGVKFSINTCKIIFRYLKLSQMYIHSLVDSFIQRNILGFFPPHKISLTTDIQSVYLELYNIKIGQRLLDQDVFKNVKIIELRGQISQIDKEIFQDLKNLYGIYLYALNLRQLYSKGIEWITSINKTRISNLSNKSEIVHKLFYFTFIFTFDSESLDATNVQILRKPYLYPDEDFCWFKDFPFDRLVFLDPHMYCENNCSCTQYWLLRYAYFLNVSQYIVQRLNSYQDIENYFTFRNYKNEIKKCNFPQRLDNCQKMKYSKTVEQHSSFKSALVDSQIADFVAVNLIPIVSAFGIVINILNSITIAKIDLNKTPEEKQQKTLVRFMLAYSIVNLLYCVIYSLSLMSKCIELNSIFCSELYFTQFAQYFKVIFVEFVGSNLKTFSNVVYFCISVNRYILLEKESKLAKFIERTISTWSKRKKIIWILAISIILAGLNSHKVIIYRVMDYSFTNLFEDTYPQYFFSLPFFMTDSEFYERSFNYEPTKALHHKSIVYEVFTYINFILNDVIFYFVFTIVDILLVVAFKKSTETKKKFYKDKLNDVKIQKMITDMEQNGKKIMRVIIINALIQMIIKVLDMFMSVSKFKIWKEFLTSLDQLRKLNSFCHTVKICSVYEEFVKILTIIHFCFSIVSFYFMNKNFKINLINIFCKKTKKSTSQ